MKTESQQKFQSKMLADCRDILEANGITAILTNSALLGAYRDGDLIPHCYGAVFTCFRSEVKPRELTLLKDLGRAGFKVVKHFINDNYKIRIIKPFDGKTFTIEIVAYSDNGQVYYRQLKKKKKIIPKKLLRPPYSKIKLRGETYTAPKNIPKFLRFLYVNWKIKRGPGGSPSAYKNGKHMVVKK